MAMIILMLVLTIILWLAYYKIFHVIYFDALKSIILELAGCFIIAAFIVGSVSNAISGIFHKDKADSVDYLGLYWNDGLLQGSGISTSIILQKSDSHEDQITVEGSAFFYGDTAGSGVYVFEKDIDAPEGNTFSFYEDTYGMTITITADPKKKSLTVEQENTNSSMADVFSGHYVDNETWEKNFDEVQKATQDAIAASQINTWIYEYFDYYVPYPENSNETRSIRIEYDQGSSTNFHFILYKQQAGQAFPNQRIFDIPYPLGPDVTGKIEYNGPEDSISFEIRNLNEDGRQLIEITDCTYSDYIGVYISAPTQTSGLDAYHSQQGTTVTEDKSIEEPSQETTNNGELGNGQANTGGLNNEAPTWDSFGNLQPPTPKWDGTYVCNNGGDDGVKTLTVTESGNALTFEIFHTYGDGRTDSISGQADIGTYGNGSMFASYENEKILYFTLSSESIEISQIGIYPAVDLEYDGLYTKTDSSGPDVLQAGDVELPSDMLASTIADIVPTIIAVPGENCSYNWYGSETVTATVGLQSTQAGAFSISGYIDLMLVRLDDGSWTMETYDDQCAITYAYADEYYDDTGLQGFIIESAVTIGNGNAWVNVVPLDFTAGGSDPTGTATPCYFASSDDPDTPYILQDRNGQIQIFLNDQMQPSAFYIQY